jgi:hypothetical protein
MMAEGTIAPRKGRIQKRKFQSGLQRTAPVLVRDARLATESAKVQIDFATAGPTLTIWGDRALKSPTLSAPLRFLHKR